MPKLAWYWHRLTAMDPVEAAWHLRTRLPSFKRAAPPDWNQGPFPDGQSFPRLPSPSTAPMVLKTALDNEQRQILAGEWKVFSHLTLKVDDPPRWQKDCLAGQDLQTDRKAIELDHRKLPAGVDIKLIWEPSRWSHLVRLAQASYLTNDPVPAQTCIRWLDHWHRTNPPLCGWNWISPLETGLRLVQFAWIDALLEPRWAGRSQAGNASAASEPFDKTSWKTLCQELLPPHVWFTWRYHSRGSSANNHLIGELAGLVLALVRWPALAAWATPLEDLQTRWEKEVLLQFAPDGGNREQALNYHLFSWEFCWQTRLALLAAGRKISPPVEDRLRQAAHFFAALQVEKEQWDFGDSDNGFVTPFFLAEENMFSEWREWILKPGQSPAIHYWLGQLPEERQFPGRSAAASRQNPEVLGGSEPAPTRAEESQPGALWQLFPESGLAVARRDGWVLRFDLSPLGFLATAAHGHLDALHVSIWREGEAFVIDPGTGAYYADPRLRNYLASWAAHNGPVPAGSSGPVRLGPFLWGKPHPRPEMTHLGSDVIAARLTHSAGVVERLVRFHGPAGWTVEDRFEPIRPGAEFSVFWQFPPGARLTDSSDGSLRVARERGVVTISPGEGWAEAKAIRSPEELRGVCSPSFRRTAFGPGLLLRATARGPMVLTTGFRGENSPKPFAH